MQNVEAPALAARSREQGCWSVWTIVRSLREAGLPWACSANEVTMPVLTRGLNDKNEEAGCSEGHK